MDTFVIVIVVGIGDIVVVVVPTLTKSSLKIILYCYYGWQIKPYICIFSKVFNSYHYINNYFSFLLFYRDQNEAVNLDDYESYCGILCKYQGICHTIIMLIF